MKILLKIMDMVDKIYHAIVKDAEDEEDAEGAEKNESEE